MQNWKPKTFLPLLFCLLPTHIARADAPARLSAIVRLEATPNQIEFTHREARQSLLITGYLADGTAVDLTETAKVEADNPSLIRWERKNILTPCKEGRTLLHVRYKGVTTAVPLSIRSLHTPFAWSFENHVEAVLSKQGCNMGICHGGASGKGGFKLSLRAYDPDKDYERLRYEGRGRRLVVNRPERSLLLLKPTLAVAHSGGVRLQRGTLEYQVLHEWIGRGALGVSPQTPRITRLSVFPEERVLLPKGEQRLQVTAFFSDGHAEDVTYWAKYTSNDDLIARVDERGKATMRGYGEATVSVGYLGQVNYARLRVPYPRAIAPARFARLPRANFIDDYVNRKLAQVRLLPSERSGDSVFLRRIMLDTIGVLPTLEELQKFTEEKATDKRERLISDLLKRPEFTDYWTYRWSDLLRLNRDILGGKGLQSFYQFVRKSVEDNRPWDRFVYEIVTAQGSNQKAGAANFYRIGSSPEEYAENVSQAFLGIRMQCAHCHNHPHEKWSQADYYRFANLFARVERKEVKKKDDPDPEEIVSIAAKGDVSHPRLGKPLPPAPLEGAPLDINAPEDRRIALAKWIIAPSNPFFARSIVNRIWKYLMGQGLYEPADDLRVTNPSMNEALLRALTADFVAKGFDMRSLIRTILLSEAYQRSARVLPENREDERYYARYLPRRLPAEALLDAIGQVTGRAEAFEGSSPGTRASALADTRTPSAFLDLFGRPPRQVTCECERGAQTGVAQALHLINAETLNQKIPAQGGRLEQLITAGRSDVEILNTLYRVTFSREPTPAEKRVALSVLAEATTDNRLTSDQKQANRKQVFADLLWAMMSGKEFLFNH